ncbi:hypothetical protein PSTT_10533 [Puccinia striiformis]|uniref:Retrovirus-related Pol polyprotein from transposon TNT 1-94-like beta-barrel domain-containing protein n=1 Tax=Puccinia striiformis TaxID=27350 RepID=A0A2S4V3Z5_9BASI|nr:hypothetical protein PSTT_10533 [Puccinia striiformis]
MSLGRLLKWILGCKKLLWSLIVNLSNPLVIGAYDRPIYVNGSRRRTTADTNDRDHHTTRMAGTSNNDGFRQAMLKTALETTPQLAEENYSIWKDKMTALLQLRGVLKALDSEEPDVIPLADDVNAELNLLFISKIDSVTHNNIVTADTRGSAKALWKAIKDRYTSAESSNRARVFNDFLYVKFKEDALEAFVTDIKVAIKKLVDVGIDLPQDILAYLILFKLPDSLQLLKRQIMHSDKSLTVQFVCNHLTQYSNENKAEIRESSSSTQAALLSTRNQKSGRNGERGGQGNSGGNGPKRCESLSRLVLASTPGQSTGLVARSPSEVASEQECQLLSIPGHSLDQISDPKHKIVLDSGASVHIFNDTKFFDKLELGDRDVIRTGKEGATLPIKGVGRVILQWGNSTIAMDNCLYVPDIVINLISAGALLEKGCEIAAKKGKFTVLKDQLKRFEGRVENNLFVVDKPDSVGGTVKHSAHFAKPSSESLRSIHEKFGHASLQRLGQFIPTNASKAEIDEFECKACTLSKITKQPFKTDSELASKVFERIHLNIIGPITPEAKIKSRFILTLVDNYSGYLTGFPLAKKDDTTMS